MKIMIIKLLGISLLGILIYNYSLQLNDNYELKKIDYLELSINNALNACYANEGSYPQTLDYLVENYHIILNDSFNVYYESFASNIRPKVKVVYVK